MIASKQFIVSMISLSAALPLAAQVKKTSTPTRTTHAAASKASTTTLKTQLDSVSYAIGLSVANFYKQSNLTNINTALLVKAINDVRNNGKLLMDDQQANTCMMNFMQKAKAEKSAGNRKVGEEFLEANKNKPGVVNLPSGLQYIVEKEGTGPKPGPSDKVKVHYHGTLIDGRVFDSSVDRGQPIELSVNSVIPGWTEALQLMPVGSKWKLFIPSNLGYGDQQAGPLITPGSTLIFEVELLDIIK
jgi:FKBP-type peptidyl-prolyl cis-trans isomerase FklB